MTCRVVVFLGCWLVSLESRRPSAHLLTTMYCFVHLQAECWAAMEAPGTISTGLHVLQLVLLRTPLETAASADGRCCMHCWLGSWQLVAEQRAGRAVASKLQRVLDYSVSRSRQRGGCVIRWGCLTRLLWSAFLQIGRNLRRQMESD